MCPYSSYLPSLMCSCVRSAYTLRVECNIPTAGKDLMVPLNLFCIFSNALVYYFTGESVWLLTSALCVFPLVWTVVAMAPTIVSLQSARDELPDDEDLYVAVRKFCRLHLVRLVAMLAAATITAHTVATKA
eukprot:Opistho-2@63714